MLHVDNNSVMITFCTKQCLSKISMAVVIKNGKKTERKTFYSHADILGDSFDDTTFDP